MISSKAARQVHRMLAIGLGTFILLHLCVHLTALGGPNIHNSALKAVQWMYRNPVIEPILFLVLITQAATGTSFLARKWRLPNKGFWGWTQIVTGLILAWFMLQHALAAMMSRYIFGLDTNFYWVAGPLQHSTLRPVFIPYYFLLVFALFAHLAAFAHFRLKRKSTIAVAIACSGALTATLIVATFAGAFYTINIPADYKLMYENMARGDWP
jgi:succinate dehydrogenase/fumarate reductase cytochrome b subunit